MITHIIPRETTVYAPNNSYQPMFGNPILVQTSPLYYFEKPINYGISGYNVFVKHMFWYKWFLEMVTNESEAVSITSDDKPVITEKLTLKMVAREWNLNSFLIKKAWKVRSNRLNQCPVPSLFDKVPEPIIAVNHSELLFNDLHYNWSRVFRSIHSEMLSKRRLEDLNRYMSIRYESVRIGKYIYKQLYISPSLRKSLFGKIFEIVKNEIVSKTAKRTILHVWSLNRIKQILTLANECASTVHREEHNYHLYGKIDYRRYGRKGTAYIIRETEASFTICNKSNRLEEISKTGLNTIKIIC